MILYTSLQTDIPAFYLDWFIERIKSKYVDIPTLKHNTVERYDFEINKIDYVHFFTRDPSLLVKQMDEIKSLQLPFDVTVFMTFLDKYYEPKIKDKDIILNYIRKLSKQIGKKHTILGYGPIFKTSNNSLDWHINQFKFLCKILKKDISSVCIDFEINNYCQESKELNAIKLIDEEQKDMIKKLTKIAEEFKLNLTIKKKVEELEDNELDLGIPNSCLFSCKYCKYVTNMQTLKTINSLHNKYSSLLIGSINDSYKIINVNKKNKKNNNEIKQEYSQISFF